MRKPKIDKAKYSNRYTNEQKDKVIELFYRTELRNNEDIIDNTSNTISKETGVSVGIVNDVIALHLKNKYKLLNEKINKQ